MGKVIKFQNGATLEEDKLRRFLNHELTWAEVEGMTAEQAGKISKIGCDLAARGRMNDARIIFEGLVAGNPKDTSAQAALGAVYQRLGRREEALRCFDAAIALLPCNVVALAHRGELRLRAGDAGGLEDLARAVEVDVKGVSAAGRRARGLLAALARSRKAQGKGAPAVAAAR